MTWENEVQTANPKQENRKLKYYNNDYGLISEMGLKELKNYFWINALIIKGRKSELLARVFIAIEVNVNPIKTTVEVEADLKAEYLAKLKIDDWNIPNPFKIPFGWMNEDKGRKF